MWGINTQLDKQKRNAPLIGCIPFRLLHNIDYLFRCCLPVLRSRLRLRS